jgi:hypothetical protein
MTSQKRMCECEGCNNESAHTLETHVGHIDVCESCDDNFSYCRVCGMAVPFGEGMIRFLNPEDENMTCSWCEPHEDNGN